MIGSTSVVQGDRVDVREPPDIRRFRHCDTTGDTDSAVTHTRTPLTDSVVVVVDVDIADRAAVRRRSTPAVVAS